MLWLCNSFTNGHPRYIKFGLTWCVWTLRIYNSVTWRCSGELRQILLDFLLSYSRKESRTSKKWVIGVSPISKCKQHDSRDNALCSLVQLFSLTVTQVLQAWGCPVKEQGHNRGSITLWSHWISIPNPPGDSPDCHRWIVFQWHLVLFLQSILHFIASQCIKPAYFYFVCLFLA